MKRVAFFKLQTLENEDPPGVGMHPCLTPKRRTDNLEIDGRSIDRTSRTVYKWHIAIGYVQSPCFRKVTPLYVKVVTRWLSAVSCGCR